MTKLRLCAVVLMAANLAACATVTRGTRQDYVIETDPAGAQIACRPARPAPRRARCACRASMSSSSMRQCRATSRRRRRCPAGCAPAAPQAFAGNILLGGIIGGVVDGSNGSTNDLRPNPLQITMVRLAPAAEPLAVVADETAAPEAAEASEPQAD